LVVIVSKKVFTTMFLSFTNVVFACLSLASAGASLSNDNLLEMMSKLEDSVEEMKKTMNGQIEELEETIEGLEETIEELSNNKGSSNKSRKLHTKKGGKGGQGELNRNICYSKDEQFITVFAECEAAVDDDYYYWFGTFAPTSGTATPTHEGFADCSVGGSRRELTNDEARRNLQEMRVKRDLCEFSEPAFTDTGEKTNIGMLEVGSVMIEKE
jgi:hypothetical protein